MKKIFKILCIFLFIVSTILLSVRLEDIKAQVVYPFNGIIHADALVVYSNTSATKATELAYGTRVSVLESSGSIKGVCSNSYKIGYDDNKVGYACSSYITNIDVALKTDNISSGDTYDTYCNNLVSNGFDKSYCPYLYYLHSKYPNWTFKADVSSYTLEEAAKEEEDKVVLQTSNPNYWLNGKYIEGDYYYINQATIVSFMDPRNSLFESTIFQFLDLEESKDIYNDTTLKKISGSSGNLANYIDSFKKAASVAAVNPVHIMSRSVQEGANKASYSAVTGLYTTNSGRTSAQGYSLDGYYNFYNIGSYADKVYSYTVQRGLAYAAGFLEDDKCMVKNSEGKYEYSSSVCGELSYSRPWNSPEQAIIGGAQFIVNDYISRGQDNLYFQKFNIATYSSINHFTHQYMTNIYAPASESRTMYNAYDTGALLNSKFTFVIPVYKNMPSDGIEAVNKSSNSKLSSITVDDKVITGFDREVVEYSYNAVTSHSQIKVGAKTEDSKASVSGTGNYDFVNGSVSIDLIVTAEDGSSTTYKLLVKQVIPEENITVNDIVGKMGVKINDSIMYGISPGTVVSTLVNTVANNKGKATVVDSNNKSKTTGNLVTGDKITISGTNETKEYIIAIRGDVSGDGLVKINDLILVQSHILGKNKLTGAKFYAGDINYDSLIKINDLILIQSQILGKVKL